MPNWLEVRSVAGGNESGLTNLYPGEREAIMLAENLAANLIIIDERAGRALAEIKRFKSDGIVRNIRIIGRIDCFQIN